MTERLKGIVSPKMKFSYMIAWTLLSNILWLKILFFAWKWLKNVKISNFLVIVVSQNWVPGPVSRHLKMSAQAISCLPKVRTQDSWISKTRQETAWVLTFWRRETGPGTQFWETTIARKFDIFAFLSHLRAKN